MLLYYSVMQFIKYTHKKSLPPINCFDFITDTEAASAGQQQFTAKEVLV